MAENRNLILAIVLSMLVLLGWQYFIAGPRMEQARLAELARQSEQTGTQAPATGTAAQPGTTPAAVAPGNGSLAVDVPVVTRDAALEKSKRVPVETPEVIGSINLTGGKIDDLSLKNYRETVDKTSPMVTLLSPLGANFAYYAETGFVVGDATVVPKTDTVWTAPEGARLTPTTPLTLTFDNGAGLIFTRVISVDEHTMFTIKDQVENKSAASATLNPYGFLIRYGVPVSQATWVLHEGLLGVFGDAGLTEVTYSKLKDSVAVKPDASKTGWLGITDKYWAAALIPADGMSFQPRFLHSTVGTTDTYQADFLSDPIVVAPGASASNEIRLFAGAKTVERINAYNDSLKLDRFDLMIDWGWFGFLTKPMFWLLDFFYKLVGNFGVAVLLVTVFVKTVFFPLANKSYASMSKMKKIQPEMEQLKVTYKDDKVKQQQALMELYKKEKINPVAGCLPVLIQIPVFFSLYKVLYGTIEMRHAPFFGWIQDLSAPDPTSLFNLFGMLPYGVPHALMIGVWPIIMGITMFVQMKLNPTPPDPTQAMIFTWMPLVFTFMLASFPAGLVIYWAWNNTLSILQQSLIMKRHGVKIELFDNLRAMFRKKAKQGS